MPGRPYTTGMMRTPHRGAVPGFVFTRGLAAQNRYKDAGANGKLRVALAQAAARPERSFQGTGHDGQPAAFRRFSRTSARPCASRRRS